MENTSSPSTSIWVQMQEVERLQERTASYLSLYEKFIIQSSQQNEFLARSSFTILSNEELENKKQQINEAKSEAIQPCESSRQIIEENIEFQPKKMNLSRIFQEITLGNEVKSHSKSNFLDICLLIQDEQIVFRLNQSDNSYNLSNFSSFNNQKSDNNSTQFDIKDLLSTIQQRIGKQLSRKGIESVINQIQLSVLDELEEQQLKDSEITQNTLFHSHINNQNMVNNQNLFELENAKSIKETLKQNKTGGNVRRKQDDTETKDAKIQRQTDQFIRSSKENSQSLYQKKRGNQVSKEIRIIKKNSLKNSLIMMYTDLKQLQNFCISNKIYGKDKEKIIKAIRQNKNIVTLD